MKEINQQRAEFESWWVAPGPEFTDEEDIAWQAWQAATTKEREACAQLIATHGLDLCPGDKDMQRHYERSKQARATYATAIRARGQEAS